MELDDKVRFTCTLSKDLDEEFRILLDFNSASGTLIVLHFGKIKSEFFEILTDSRLLSRDEWSLCVFSWDLTKIADGFWLFLLLVNFFDGAFLALSIATDFFLSNIIMIIYLV